MKRRKGRLITFEKIADGLGGTTQAHKLYENLKRAGYDAILTREPGGTGLGEKVRALLLDPEFKLGKATELFLFQADRSQHYKEVLKPALSAGKIVISDRFFDSTMMYQGHGRGWKTSFLLRLHQASTGMLLPDLTFVLCGTPFADPTKVADRIETEGNNFKKKISAGMLRMARQSDRYILVNANDDVNALSQYIYSVVRKRVLLST